MGPELEHGRGFGVVPKNWMRQRHVQASAGWSRPCVNAACPLHSHFWQRDTQRTTWFIVKFSNPSTSQKHRGSIRSQQSPSPRFDLCRRSRCTCVLSSCNSGPAVTLASRELQQRACWTLMTKQTHGAIFVFVDSDFSYLFFFAPGPGYRGWADCFKWSSEVLDENGDVILRRWLFNIRFQRRVKVTGFPLGLRTVWSVRRNSQLAKFDSGLWFCWLETVPDCSLIKVQRLIRRKCL